MAAVTAAFMAGSYLAGTVATAVGAGSFAAGTAAAIGGVAAGAATYDSLGNQTAIGAVKDSSSPDMPEVSTPDPAAEASSLGAMQANERALRDRKGLATTKVVNKSLLAQKKRSSLGASAV